MHSPHIFSFRKFPHRLNPEFPHPSRYAPLPKHQEIVPRVNPLSRVRLRMSVVVAGPSVRAVDAGGAGEGVQWEVMREKSGNAAGCPSILYCSKQILGL